MIPGLTTKLLEGCVNCVMVGFEDCRRHYKHPEKVVVTGTPVRGDFFALTKQQAREKLGYTDDKPLVASFWGSLGASTMNARMLDFFRREQADGFPFHHIHAAGKSDWPHVSGELERLGLSSPLLDVRQYIYDMAVVMAAADLVISRAGASTLSEVTALGMPTILVPSPYVVANHQEKNARLLESHGGAVMLTEEQGHRRSAVREHEGHSAKSGEAPVHGKGHGGVGYSRCHGADLQHLDGPAVTGQCFVLHRMGKTIGKGGAICLI